jgi:polyferredoxin
LSIVAAGVLYTILTRIPLEVDIIRDRNVLYTETTDGLIQNVYNLKIINMDQQPQRYRLSVSGLEGIQVIGQTDDITIESGAVMDLPLRVEVDPVELNSSSNEILFHIESLITPEIQVEEHARFLGPAIR